MSLHFLSFFLAALLLPAAAPQPPDLAAVLARTGRAVERYADEAAAVIGVEQCEQRELKVTAEWRTIIGGQAVQESVENTVARRRWRADVALVATRELAGRGYPWAEFRDVCEVDGKPIPDRESRLERLMTAPEWRLDRARMILEESARYNVGPEARSFNTPALPLLALHPANQARFAFSRAGTQKVDGIDTWKIDFREERRPTLLRGSDLTDAPATGTFWIDPKTGDVVRALLRANVAEAWNEMTVTYRRPAGLDLCLPVAMTERVTFLHWQTIVEGQYRYSGYRRFVTGARLLDIK